MRVEALESAGAPGPAVPANVEVRRTVVRAKAIVRLIPLTRMLGRAIADFKPDVVWSPTYRGFGMPMLLCCSAASLPYGVYFHGTEIVSEVRRRARRVILKRVVKGAALVATNSRNTADLLQRHLPDVTVQVITPGVNAHGFSSNDLRTAGQRLRESLVNESGSDAGSVILLSMCRHTRGKGLHTVLQALSQIGKEVVRPYFYMIAGAGPETDALKQLAQELQLTDKVRFLGPLPYQDAPKYYCAADIYVQPSQPDGDFLESFGISFLEAQAAGLACIGSNWGGVPEAVSEGKTALLVPPGDVGALKRALVELINDRTRRKQMGEAGREWAAAHSWNAHAQSLSSALAAIAKKPALR